MSQRESRTRKQNVLIVDDDKAILQTFSRMLSAEGLAVDTAETGKDALENAEKKHYDLAIIDIRLADMQGTKLLSLLRRNVPITKKIIVTGFPSVENAAESVNLHADAYLVKPVSPNEFLRVVRQKLQEHAAEEEVTEGKVMDWVETRYLKAKHEPANTETASGRKGKPNTSGREEGA